MTKGKSIAALVLIFTAVLVFGFSNGVAEKVEDMVVPPIKAANAQTPFDIDAYTQKLRGESKDQLEDEVVSEIENCESHGDYGIIIFDTNNEASVGGLQFQRKTVQHYVKKFEGRAISKEDAIAIAINKDEARALAKKIIFEDGGVGNWFNCAKQVDAAGQIKLISSLK